MLPATHLTFSFSQLIIPSSNPVADSHPGPPCCQSPYLDLQELLEFVGQLIPSEVSGFGGVQGNDKCSGLEETFLVIPFPLEELQPHAAHLVHPEMH